MKLYRSTSLTATLGHCEQIKKDLTMDSTDRRDPRRLSESRDPDPKWDGQNQIQNGTDKVVAVSQSDLQRMRASGLGIVKINNWCKVERTFEDASVLAATTADISRMIEDWSSSTDM